MPGQLLEEKMILVVDDDPTILRVVTAILKQAHFNVLEAMDGSDALRVAADHAGMIDLLLSDVQMPEMSGPDLGKALKVLRPELRVMLMSGFHGGALLVLNYGWAFIEKPFVATKLVQMVNNVLHSPDRSQGSNQYDTRDDLKS